MMRYLWMGVIWILPLALGIGSLEGQEKKGHQTQMSFKSDVKPIIESHCLPCHAEDNFNPSELNLDSYSGLMEGGKHGPPVVRGKSEKSIIIQKLGTTPPFGDPMPLVKKGRKPKSLTPEEIATIARWIDQGAKNN